MGLTRGNVILDVFRLPVFQKYSTCWVFQAFFWSTFLRAFCNLTTLIFLCAGKEEQSKTKLFPAHFWIGLRIDFRSPFLGNLPPFPRKCAKIPANLREDEIYSHTEAAVDEGEYWNTETTLFGKVNNVWLSTTRVLLNSSITTLTHLVCKGFSN